MLNSLFLESYSPLIIVLNSVVGFLFLERGIIRKKIDLIGGILLLSSFLLYIDRLLKPNLEYAKKVLIPVCLGTIYIFYLIYLYLVMKKYHQIKFLFYIVIFGLFLTLGWAITNDKVDSQNTQYVFGSILGIIISLFILIPIHRKKGEVFSLSLVLLSFSLTVLVFSSISTPVTNF